jgi:methylenetetrahydrofolate reductase (NADPH)
MKHHILGKMYHVEIVPPKQDSEQLREDLAVFAEKFKRVMESGWCACLTDNAMGRLAFQGHEVIEELGLKVSPDQVMLHLSTFHTISSLHEILDSCLRLGIRNLLVVSGDGSVRLPKLQPGDLSLPEGGATVTSVELIAYIHAQYPGQFQIGAAFNPYEPPEHEFEKLARKLKAGASFVITQPIIAENAVVDELLEKHPDLPVFVEAWMSKRISLLSEAVGYVIPEDTAFDPVETLKALHGLYPHCGFYLSLLGFKTQYHLVRDTWV